MKITKEDFKEALRAHLKALSPNEATDIIELMITYGVEFKAIPVRPDRDAYDFDRMWELLEYTQKLQAYTDYIEEKI